MSERHSAAVDLVPAPTDTGCVKAMRFAAVPAVLRIAPIVALLLAAAVAARAAGARQDDDTAPIVSGLKAVVSAKWSEGWLVPGAGIKVTGQAPYTIARAGRFALTLPLSARPLPGPYRLSVVNAADPLLGKLDEVTVTIPSPPEGVLDYALVGPTQNGPWSRYERNQSPVLRGKRSIVWMRFIFLSPPKGTHITLWWKLRYKWTFKPVDRRFQKTIDTHMTNSEGPLPTGRWTVQLRVDNRVAKQMVVRIVD